MSFLVGCCKSFNLLTINGITLGEELYIRVVDTKLENWQFKEDDIVIL